MNIIMTRIPSESFQIRIIRDNQSTTVANQILEIRKKREILEISVMNRNFSSHIFDIFQSIDCLADIRYLEISK
uniref:Transcriptional regulator n=1 Tax=Caenorhabditis tropicalis TaxID=1561998 RepID=A0A1I7UE33_9PELO